MRKERAERWTEFMPLRNSKGKEPNKMTDKKEGDLISNAPVCSR